MSTKSATTVAIDLGRSTRGVFDRRAALAAGMSERELRTLLPSGAVERVLPAVYRLAASSRTWEQSIHAAQLWAGPASVVVGQSAVLLHGIAVREPVKPNIAIPCDQRKRHGAIDVVRYRSRSALMPRWVRGLTVAGVEAALCGLAAAAPDEALEVACEDARRRRLTSISAMVRYLDRFAAPGRNGTQAMRDLLVQLDPASPSNSVLEVKTRRLLVERGFSDFVREMPMVWGNRRYCFDFVFPVQRVVLETNGRRWQPVSESSNGALWTTTVAE